MNLFRNPAWIDNLKFPYQSFEDIPLSVFKKVNADLDKVLSEEPLVSVVVAAWNEEVNILNCVASLSRSQSGIPFEIVVVNNNSTDNTQQTLDKLHVKSFFQEIQGWGPARQLGLEKARGKYVLLADADCFYPPYWMHEMMKVLQQPGVVCVYGRYSFISEPGFPRWKLYLMEKMKDAIAEVRHIKRPYLNAYGMSMGYIREYGLKAGYVMRKIRGEDGRMCFDLMQYGKVKQVKADRARVWTWTRTLQQEGSITKAIFTRVRKELGRLGDLFKTPPPHDTKTSTN